MEDCLSLTTENAALPDRSNYSSQDEHSDGSSYQPAERAKFCSDSGHPFCTKPTCLSLQELKQPI